MRRAARRGAGPVLRGQEDGHDSLCDLTGSTSLGESQDPEQLRRVMSRYYEEARAVLERHGGQVEKFIGDAVMAVFGSRSCTRTMRCAR